MQRHILVGEGMVSVFFVFHLTLEEIYAYKQMNIETYERKSLRIYCNIYISLLLMGTVSRLF